MALIKCPECGKEISDKAIQCIHCGYPIQQTDNNICNVNGVEYDLSFLKDYAFNNDNISTQDRALAIKQIQKITNLKYPEKLFCEIVANKKIPEIYSGPMVQKQSSSVLRCPNCKSTNVKRITTGSRIASIALVGIASDKIGKQYECKNCKYKW